MTDDGLDIPDYLRLTPEQRAEGWRRNPPKPMPSFGREYSETERLYRASIERDKAAKRAVDEARWAELRAKTAQDKAERAAVAAEVERKRREVL